MDKTELMLKYEQETGEEALMKYFLINRMTPWLATDEYVEWLESKAEAYERMEKALLMCVDLFKNIRDYGAMRHEEDWLKVKFVMQECIKALPDGWEGK